MTEQAISKHQTNRNTSNDNGLESHLKDLERRFQEHSAALEESEDRFRNVFQELPDACFLIDREGRFLDGNKAVVKLTGYTKDELVGLRVHECGIFPPAAKQHAAARLRQLNETGALEPTTYNLLHRDGSELPVEVTSIPITLEGETVVLSCVRDLRFRQHSEHALQESEEKYRRLFESETDAILLFDAETRQFIDVNDAAVKSYGYTREEFLQMTHRDITAEADAAEQVIRKNLDGQPPSSIRSKHRRRNGTVFPVEITGCSFLVKGRPTVCGVVRDITEREKSEQKLLRNHEEMRHLATELSMAQLRERQRIAAELHDGICQMLSSSSIRLAILKESELSEQTAGAIDTVCRILEDSLKQTRSLIFELSCPMLKELGLEAALEELCSAMSNEHSVLFEFTGNHHPLPLTFDEQTHLYRSVRELLTNVAKHSKARTARVALTTCPGRLKISVKDDGIGFDASSAGRGFSPTGGFGLFNLCEYLQHIGGTLSIASSPGSGTQATITFPLEARHD